MFKKYKEKKLFNKLNHLAVNIDELFSELNVPAFEILVDELEEKTGEYLITSELFSGVINIHEKTVHLEFFIYTGKDSMSNVYYAQSSITMFSIVGSLIGKYFSKYTLYFKSTFSDMEKPEQEKTMIFAQLFSVLKMNLNDDDLFNTIASKLTGQYGVG